MFKAGAYWAGYPSMTLTRRDAHTPGLFGTGLRKREVDASGNDVYIRAGETDTLMFAVYGYTACFPLLYITGSLDD